jgi:hypothetical protein
MNCRFNGDLQERKKREGAPRGPGLGPGWCLCAVGLHQHVRAGPSFGNHVEGWGRTVVCCFLDEC